MRACPAIWFVLLLGCGAQLEENAPTDARAADARTQIDAPAAADASPDVRLCAGGDARATDPSTGSCFVYFSAPTSYPDAEAACAAFGAKLAVIKSAQTNAVVRSLVGQTDAFVGADDRDVEGTYRWLGDVNDPVSAGYTNWRSGEPNNGGSSSGNEDCMIIEGDEDGTWDDRPCTLQASGSGVYAYVCQF